jgi:Transposase DDE domain
MSQASLPAGEKNGKAPPRERWAQLQPGWCGDSHTAYREPARQLSATATNPESLAHPHEDLLRAARAQARTPEFKEKYPARSAIERIISWTATWHGRRIRPRCTGNAKNDAWLHNRCAAINLRTLVNAGLTRSERAWALA